MVNSEKMWRVQVRYRLTSTMRIGHRLIGNLQTTRYYVPGMALWASAVNRLARKFPEGDGNGNPYLYWGRALRESCRFSCLFLVDPMSENGDLLLDFSKNRRKIENLFIGSSVHTAIRHDDYVREEGMLHELEWILPKTRTGLDVEFRGWLDVRQQPPEGKALLSISSEGEVLVSHGKESYKLEEILTETTVGADLNAGCGRLEKVAWEIAKVVDVITEWNKENLVPGQLLPGTGTDITGRLETMVGRSMLPIDENLAVNPGKSGSFLYHYLAYAPGAKTCGNLEMDWIGRFKHVDSLSSDST